jgi:hypothetical protein
MPSVTIRVLTDDPVPVLIEDVVIEFYDGTTAIFQTSGVTSSAGEVIVTLPDGSYDVLLYKVGITVLPKQPQRIVVDTLLTNVFEVSAHPRIRPESIDPRRTTVSGSVIGVDGKQAKHRLVFEPVKTVTVLSHMVIAPYSRREVASNEAGYFEFELLRNTKYSAYFVFPEDLFGQQPGKLDVVVPNGPGVALDVLLFPVPVNLTFSVPTISLVSGGPWDETTDVVLTYSDGSIRESTSSPWAYVAVTNTDASVVEASIADAKKLILRPLTPGTATITTVRTISDRAFFDPAPVYVTQSVIVTVT